MDSLHRMLLILITAELVSSHLGLTDTVTLSNDRDDDSGHGTSRGDWTVRQATRPEALSSRGLINNHILSTSEAAPSATPAAGSWYFTSSPLTSQPGDQTTIIQQSSPSATGNLGNRNIQNGANFTNFLTTATPPTSTSPGDHQPIIVLRGDLPLQLDSEETIEDVTGLLFVPPVSSSSHSPQNSTGVLGTRPHSTSSPVDLRRSTPTSAHLMSDNLATNNVNRSNTSPEVTVALANTLSRFEDTTISDFDLLQEDSHSEGMIEAGKIVTTSSPLSEVMTLDTPSFLELHKHVTWFMLVLRGDCTRVNLSNIKELHSDFIMSLLSLLLLNKKDIVIDSMGCSNMTMTVNMSVASNVSLDFESSMKTLLTHKNIRINLHNASFYIESYETKQTLIFETKPDVDKNNSEILYLILGAVGVSLICIIFAGVFFAIYQCCVLRKDKLVFTDVTDKFLPESPRSLRPSKVEVDHRMRLSDTHTYTVNMYRSFNDLSSPELYGHLDSPDLSAGSTHNKSSTSSWTTANNTSANGTKSSRNTTGNELKSSNSSKNQKKKNKKNCSPENHHQELWTESITQTSEEVVTLRNANPLTSTFKNANIPKEPEEGRSHPLLLLKNGRSSAEVNKAFSPHPTTCPSSPAIPKSVLRRMDDLISGNFSNSSPNIYGGDGCWEAVYYPNTTSATNTTATTSSTTPGVTSTTSSTSSGRKGTAATSATSAENLCLTRITFMGMDNPSFRMETDM